MQNPLTFLYQMLLFSYYLQAVLSKDYNVGWSCVRHTYSGQDCAYAMTVTFRYYNSTDRLYLLDDDQISLSGNYETPGCRVNGTFMTVQEFDRNKYYYAQFDGPNPTPQILCNGSYMADFYVYTRYNAPIDNQTARDAQAIVDCLVTAMQKPRCEIEFTSHEQKSARDTKIIAGVLGGFFGLLLVAGTGCAVKRAYTNRDQLSLMWQNWRRERQPLIVNNHLDIAPPRDNSYTPV